MASHVGRMEDNRNALRILFGNQWERNQLGKDSAWMDVGIRTYHNEAVLYVMSRMTLVYDRNNCSGFISTKIKL